MTYVPSPVTWTSGLLTLATKGSEGTWHVQVEVKQALLDELRIHLDNSQPCNLAPAKELAHYAGLCSHVASIIADCVRAKR